jgi:hypothetical protein
MWGDGRAAGHLTDALQTLIDRATALLRMQSPAR